MLKKRVFIKSFSDGEVTEENLDRSLSAARLENFIADEDLTHLRPGFEILFPTYKKKKAKVIPFSNNQLIELTGGCIRKIENNQLLVQRDLEVKENFNDHIITKENHNLKEEDEVYLIGESRENSVDIPFIYQVNKINSDISFKITGRNYIPNKILKVKIINKIELSNGNLDVENVKYAVSNDKIYFIDPKNKLPKTIYCYDGSFFSSKILDNFPGDFYPKAIGYYENRLILGSGNKIYFSKVNDSYDFRISASSNLAALMYEFNFGQKEEICFCYPSLGSLIIGTNLNIYIAVLAEGFLAPGKVIFKNITSYGAKAINPISFGSSLVYVERGGSLIRLLMHKDEVVHNFNLTRYAKQFKNLKKIISIRQKNESINLISEDGYIVNLTIKNSQNDTLYGSFSKITRLIDKFYDIASVSGDGNIDDLYIVSERHGRYFIEKGYKTPDLPAEYNFRKKEEYLEFLILEQKDIVLMDSAVKFNGYRKIKASIKNDILTTENTFFSEEMTGDYIKIGNHKIQIGEVISKNSIKFFNKIQILDSEYQSFYYFPQEITNLDYLEEEKISILADGGILEEKIVKNGKIKCSEVQGISKGIFGLKYEGLIISQPLASSSLDLFLNKSIEKVFLRVKNSRNFFAGFNVNDMQQISFTGYNFKNDEPVPLYTGNIELNLKNSGWDSHIRLCIVNNTPTPVNLSGIYYEVNIAQ